MIKTLRSLIHERLPVDLRVQIELLSKRRDLINEEKHQELIKLLRSFNIEDIIPLGPGTNRYAFKLNGFVIKVATDHDGKIDNLKEFKMAKRLYPYVTKIYEVSENGTLLVAEYIQPFQSYQEMCRHAEKIREILTKLSSVYLIGDVGITSKNFANWGLRVGTDDPVCLDFAYVYEVSSELFICRHCKTNAMLIPNKDFTELFCPNKVCGHRYKFEDIRARIGNDIHRHEIGDLSQEGYELTESNVSVELDEKRSNYLARKKKPKELEKPKEETVYEPFVMEHPPKYYIDHKEEIMSISENKNAQEQGFKFSNGVVIPATVLPVSPADNEEGVITAKVYLDDDIPVSVENDVIQKPSGRVMHDDDDSEGTVAFSGVMDQEMTESVIIPAKVIDDDQPETYPPINSKFVYQHQSEEEKSYITVEMPMQSVGGKNSDRREYARSVEVESSEAVQEKPRKNDATHPNFVNNMERAFSKISNRIGGHMHYLDLFADIRNHIRDRKIYPETVYRGIQNAIFRSLITFCNFEEKDVPNNNNNGTHKVFIAPKDIVGMPYEPTMIFVSRFWNNRDINCIEDTEDIMNAYKERFVDYQGIQTEWLSLLEARILEKMPVDKVAADIIVNAIKENWCVPDDNEEYVDNFQEEQGLENPFAEPYHTDPMDIPQKSVDVVQNPTDEYDNEGEYDDEEDPEKHSFYVNIIDDGEFDVVKVMSGEAFGPIALSFYTKLDNIDVSGNNDVPSIADDRNGVWDWLIHMVPDMMFYTSDPTKWLEVNDDMGETNQLHMVILNEDNGVYIMGMYYLDGIFIIDDEGESNPTIDPIILAKINKLIRDDIGYGSLSHLQRSLSMTELIRSEEYILQILEMLDNEEYESEEVTMADQENNGMTSQSESEAELAAVRAVMGETGISTEIQRAREVGDTVSQQPQTYPEPEEEFEMALPEQQQPQQVVQQPVQEPVQQPANQVAPGVFTPIRRKS